METVFVRTYLNLQVQGGFLTGTSTKIQWLLYFVTKVEEGVGNNTIVFEKGPIGSKVLETYV